MMFTLKKNCLLVEQEIIIQAQPQICATKQFIYQEFMGSWMGKKPLIIIQVEMPP